MVRCLNLVCMVSAQKTYCKIQSFHHLKWCCALSKSSAEMWRRISAPWLIKEVLTACDALLMDEMLFQCLMWIQREQFRLLSIRRQLSLSRLSCRDAGLMFPTLNWNFRYSGICILAKVDSFFLLALDCSDCVLSLYVLLLASQTWSCSNPWTSKCLNETKPWGTEPNLRLTQTVTCSTDKQFHWQQLRIWPFWS